MHEIEAFTAEGVMSGATSVPPGYRGGTDDVQHVQVDRATWHPLAGGTAVRRGKVSLETDDVLVLCAATEDLPIHAQWHSVELDAGPYHVTGELPSLPGFDPGRALARPGGPFILLRDVRVGLTGNPDGGFVERGQALVNRYAVERVVADIDLGYYFPGAGFSSSAGRAPA